MNTRVIGQGDISPLQADAGSARQHSRASRSRALALSVAAGLMALPASYGLACNYDDPVSVSRGFMNWTYPDSLYVMGAISREVGARRLPLANFDQPGLDLFGRRYLLTKKALDQFGEMLREASPGPSQLSASLVLIEPMLWTRFAQGPGGLRTCVHVSGPQRGDLVLVSGEAVIGEIAALRLTFGEALHRGLVRLYGSEAQIAQFLLAYEYVGVSGSAVDASEKQVLSPAGTVVESVAVSSVASYGVSAAPGKLERVGSLRANQSPCFPIDTKTPVSGG